MAAMGAEQPPGTGEPAERTVLAAVVRGPGSVATLAPAIRLLSGRGPARVVLIHFRQAFEERDPQDDWLEKAAKDLEDADHEMVPRHVVGQSIRGGLAEAVADAGPELLLIDSDGHDRGAERPYFAFILAPPCPSVIVHGAVTEVPASILLASAAGDEVDDSVTDLGRRLTATLADRPALTALRTAHEAVPEAKLEEYGERVRTALDGYEDLAVTGQQSKSLERGVVQALQAEQFSLAIVTTGRHGIVNALSEAALPRLLLRHEETPLLLVTPAASKGADRIRRAVNVIYRRVPSLDESDKAEVYASVRRSARGTPDFFALLGMSVALAAFGLVLNSVAVVIGAMLVAPLMLPVIGLALSVVQGDHRLLQLSSWSITRGVVGALAVALLCGWLTPGQARTDEYLARTEPATLDLLVALVAGAAGTYAIARRSVAAALPGAAIAVALVPPLAAAGLGASYREWGNAGGAALLALLNLNAIAAAAVVTFLLLGFKPEVDRFGRAGLLGRGVTLLISLLVVTTAAVVLPTRA